MVKVRLYIYIYMFNRSLLLTIDLIDCGSQIDTIGGGGGVFLVIESPIRTQRNFGQTSFNVHWTVSQLLFR